MLNLSDDELKTVLIRDWYSCSSVHKILNEAFSTPSTLLTPTIKTLLLRSSFLVAIKLSIFHKNEEVFALLLPGITNNTFTISHVLLYIGRYGTERMMNLLITEINWGNSLPIILEQIMDSACKRNNMVIVKFITKMDHSININQSMLTACEHGHLDLLKTSPARRSLLREPT